MALRSRSARGVFSIAAGSLAGLVIGSLRPTVAHDLDPQLGERMREIIDQRRFHPVYQPIYALGTGQLVAVEALTRFDAADDHAPRTPEGGFEDAARAGLATELDLAAAHAALDGAEGLLPLDVALHLNVSPATLHDRRLLGLLEAFSHRALVIELTEHAVIDDYERLDEPRGWLREHDIKLAVDDAGAGFSSLRHVVKMAPEVIKLDVTLTRDVGRDPVQLALAAALVQFTRQIGSQLIVEGIEEAADLSAWIRLEADAAQGFLLAEPGPLPVARQCSWIGPRTSREPVAVGVEPTSGRSARPDVERRAETPTDADAIVSGVARQLLHADSADEVRGILLAAVHQLGGATIVADDADEEALPVDLSLGAGAPLLPTARPGSVARERLERHVPGLVADARHALDAIARSQRLTREATTDDLTRLGTRATFARLLWHQRRLYPVGFSAGISGGASSPTETAEAADQALYRSKAAGKGCATVAEWPSVDEKEPSPDAR